MNPKTTPLVLAIFTILCALPAAGAIPSAIAQEEETSLGEDLVGGIISDVDGGDDDEENGGDAADAEIDQDSTDTATVNPNQEDHQNGDQTYFNEFRDNTADLDPYQPAANVGVPI